MKDDYFKVVYQILDYLYSCMREGIQPELKNYTWDSEALQINKSYWESIMTNLAEEGYIKGVTFKKVIGREKPAMVIRDIGITSKGIEYLAENSSMQKVKKVTKSIFEIIGYFI